MMHSA
jgi:hypothetical protein